MDGENNMFECIILYRNVLFFVMEKLLVVLVCYNEVKRFVIMIVNDVLFFYCVVLKVILRMID